MFHEVFDNRMIVGSQSVNWELHKAALDQMIGARLRRGQRFGNRLFSDPAWDILLHLYKSDLIQQRVSVSDISAMANVPATTSIRWLQTLIEEGLVERSVDPLDQRRHWVSLSEHGRSQMSEYVTVELARSSAHGTPTFNAYAR